jgi:hypothetical protein
LSQDILEKIHLLLNSDFGDPGRLVHIRDSIINEKTLYDSDRKYLEGLISKYISDSKVSHDTDEEHDLLNQNALVDHSDIRKNNSINDLKKEIDDTQNKINAMEKRIDSQERRPRHHQYKSESTTLILSVMFGLFGIMGIGHIYIGKIKRGLASMMIGFTLWMVVIIPFALLGVYDDFDEGFMLNDIESVDYSDGEVANNGMVVLLGFMAAFVIVFVGYVILYVWQILDSRKLCKAYNLHLEEHGTSLWQ